MAATQDPRVTDYLDDKLQTTADLETLDSLLLALRDQQQKLKQQLDDAQNDLSRAQQVERDHSTALQTKVREFETEQVGIDEQLRKVTGARSSEEAVEEFERSIERLNRLTVAKEYVRLVKDVNSLSDECLTNLGTSDAASLAAYKQMRDVSRQLEVLQENADGAAPYLLDHVQTKYTYLESQIETFFAGQLKKVLKQISWPTPEATIPEALLPDFNDAIEKLLELQTPELDIRERQNDGLRNVQPLVLLPLKVLLEPLELGFRYHFEGDRPTNRLERPEFFLSHVTERILAKYIDFVEIYIQPILLRKFRSTELGLNYSYIDASSALVTAVLPMLRNKLGSILPQVEQEPALLSHLIHSLIKFDTELRDEWQYTGGSHGELWPGLAFEMLNKDHVFAKWLTAEKDFALARYHEIVDTPDSFELDFDSVGAGKTKPSKAAIRLNDLLEATTDNYRELVSFQQKLRFLVDIQISVFDLFHQRLADGLSAYVARTSTIIGGSREEQARLQGVAGLERLCRIFGSADYLERAMRDWNDDVFFLELWSELQHRTSTKSGHETIAGQMTVAEVAARTSSTIHSQAGTPAEEEINPDFENGALFDETAAAYKRLRLKTEDMISELLANNARQRLTAYVRIDSWSSLAATTQTVESQPSTSAELDTFVQTIKTLLSYLARAVGTAPLRRLAKPMLQAVYNQIFNYVILAHLFSGVGAAILRTDVVAIIGVFAKHLDRSLVDASFVKLLQAITLLNLPIRPRSAGKRDGSDDAEDDSDGDRQVGLFDAGHRLFEGTGEDAKELLEQLELDTLSVGEARKILSHRIELGS